MLDVLVLGVAIILAGVLAFSPRLKGSDVWKATVTPLASIMGSGFLVSAPLLGQSVGVFAVFCMAGLLLLAYGVGSAIRFNIRHFEPIENERGPVQGISFLSRIVLAGAYFISVTYYLQLLAAFALNAVGIDSPLAADGVTTLILLVIAGIGMWRGLRELESVETWAVSLNLGMIGGLLIALLVYNGMQLWSGHWQVPDLGTEFDTHSVRVLLGLLIVVQGFETSRYLQDEHPAELRIRTMRYAQIISSTIYLLFIALITIAFHPGMEADVTAITRMVAPVAAVLPLLIAIAAMGSQFSAAVADTSGAGGLIEDLTRRRLPARGAYLLILVVTIALTWATDVNEIIAWASRAFALFYTLQCAIAVLVAHQMQEFTQRRQYLALFSVIGLLCLLVFLFGLPAE